MIPHRLLIIDDNEDTTALVKYILGRETDCQVFTALEGKEGITKALREQPDLILLDLALPEIDGIDVYKLLKSHKNTCYIPIIFISAIVGAEAIVKSQIAENVAVIVKPFDVFELVKRVTDVYESYKLTRI